MKILLTGFEPFGQEEVNSSWEAVSLMPERLNNVEVTKVRLPVSFKRSPLLLEEAVNLHTPDVVLCIGQSGGRSEINIERVALNLADSTKPDNDDYQPLDIPIIVGASEAYFSNLPVKQLKESICEQGIPAIISNSAGLYVCNSVFYTALHLIHSKYPAMRGGFIHVPYLPSQVVGKLKQPSMSAETVVTALKTVVQALSE